MKLLVASSLLFGLWPLTTLQAQAPAPDLTITNFSVWSGLPDAYGARHMAISFRVANIGNAAAAASSTRLTMLHTGTVFAIPQLPPQGAVFLSSTLDTTESEVPIEIEADVNRVVQESNEGNNIVQYTANPAGDYGRWEAIGPSKISSSPPASGRVTTIAVSPDTPPVIYAGGRDSGLWKSQGQTQTWYPITDALPTQEIDALALDPGNSSRVVVVTPSGVFQSLDGGSMWQQLTNQNLKAVGSDGGALLIGNTPAAPIYVTTKSGLQLSTNGGMTWAPVLASGSQVLSLQFGTADATQMFASTASPPAVFEAQNGGLNSASWHQLQGCPGALVPSFPKTAHVWIAESQGHQWISSRTEFPGPQTFGLWRSTTQTCTVGGFPEHGWEQVSISGNCNDFTNQWSYLFAHPRDPTVVFKGGVKLCRSSSSGDGMTEVGGILGAFFGPQLHDDQHAVVVQPSSPDTMFFGSDGGIYRSTDKGNTLNFIGEGMYNTEFLKIDVNGAGAPRVIVGGSQDNDASAWDGYSAVWSEIGPALLSGDVPLLAFERSDHRGVYLMGQSTQQIEYYPGGGGTQWSRGSLQDCDAYSEFPGAVSKGMESTGGTPPLLVTCKGIWSGPPWTQIKTPPANDEFVRLRLAPDNPQIAVAGTGQGHVFWGLAQQPASLYDVFTAPNGGSVGAIAMINEEMFYVATNTAPTATTNAQGTITRFVCLLGCTTETIWPQSQSPAGIVTALGVDPLATDSLLAAILNKGIFRGTPDSAGNWTWVPYNNGIPVGANVTDFEGRSDGSIAAATYGRGVFLLSSRPLVPPPAKLNAIGYVVGFELSGTGTNAGKPVPKTTIARLDSKPGFVFSSTKMAGAYVLQTAFKSHRRVQITYTASGQNAGTILSAVFVGQ